MKALSNWLCTNGAKNLFVKIVHPGGHVELHDRPILASELLNRNPKCCVAHPTVFQQPYAIVSPETSLVLGKKYYVVPLSTIRKLQLKHHRRGEAIDRQSVGRKTADEENESRSSVCWLFRYSGRNSGKDQKSGSYGMIINRGGSSSENSSEDTSAKVGNGGSSSSSSSPGRISLVSVDNWQPGLERIAED